MRNLFYFYMLIVKSVRGRAFREDIVSFSISHVVLLQTVQLSKRRHCRDKHGTQENKCSYCVQHIHLEIWLNVFIGTGLWTGWLEPVVI